METSALGLNIGTLTSGPLQGVGSVVSLPGGRKYKYVQFVNSAAIPAGTEVYSVVTNLAGLAIVSVSNGQKATNLVLPSQQLLVETTGPVSADTYANGYAQITSGTDIYSVRIAHNTGTDVAGPITLVFADSLQNTRALVPGTDTVSLYTSPDVVSTSTSTGGISAGYTVNSLPATDSTSPLYG